MKYKIEVAFETECLVSHEKLKEFIPFWLMEIEREFLPINNLITLITELPSINQKPSFIIQEEKK